MNKMMEKMMKKKGAKEMDPMEKEAKFSVVDAMKQMAEQAMGEKVKGLKKVTVSSPNESGLKKGLDEAEKLISANQDEPKESSEEEESEESSEEEAGEEMHSSENLEEMSEEEINAKLEELMQLKAKMKAKS